MTDSSLTRQQKNGQLFEKPPTWEEQSLSIEQSRIPIASPLWSSLRFDQFKKERTEYKDPVVYQNLLASKPDTTVPASTPPSNSTPAFVVPIKSRAYKQQRKHIFRSLFPKEVLHPPTPSPPKPPKIVSPRSNALNGCYGKFTKKRKKNKRRLNNLKEKNNNNDNDNDNDNYNDWKRKRDKVGDSIRASIASSAPHTPTYSHATRKKIDWKRKRDKVGDSIRASIASSAPHTPTYSHATRKKNDNSSSSPIFTLTNETKSATSTTSTILWPYELPSNVYYRDWWSCPTPTQPHKSIDLLAWSDLLNDETLLFSQDTQQNVEHLSFGGRSLSTSGLLNAMQSIRFQRLISLTLSNCPSMNDQVISSIGISLPSCLRAISLCNLPNVSDHGVKTIATQHGKNVRKWSIRKCARITSMCLKVLSEKAPSDKCLECIEIEECDGGTDINLVDGLAYLLDRIHVTHVKLHCSSSIATSVVFDNNSKLNTTESIFINHSDIDQSHLSRLFQGRLNASTGRIQQPAFKTIHLKGCTLLNDLGVAPLHVNLKTSTSEYRRPQRSLICKTLTCLNLSQTNVTDESVILILRKTGSLRELNVSNTNITERSLITSVAINPWMRSLIADHSRDANVSVKFLNELSKSECRNVLVQLHLQGICRGGLKPSSASAVFQHLPYLTSLSILNCIDVDDNMIDNIAVGCTKLISFKLKMGCRKLHNYKNSFGIILQRVSYFALNDAVLIKDFYLEIKPASLITCSIRGCSSLNNQNIIDLVVQSYPTLLQLNISMTQINTTGLIAVLDKCRCLHTLNVKKCPELNVNLLLTNLRSLAPCVSLTSIDFSGIKKSNLLQHKNVCQHIFPISVIGTASNLLYGHGLGRHGMYPHPSLQRGKNDHAIIIQRGKYVQELHLLHVLVQFLQNIIRGYLARRQVKKIKIKIKIKSQKIIQMVWFAYLQRMRDRKEKQIESAQYLINLYNLQLLQFGYQYWSKKTLRCRHVTNTIILQKYIRRHIWRKKILKKLKRSRRIKWLRATFQSIAMHYMEYQRKTNGRSFRQLYTFTSFMFQNYMYSNLSFGFTQWKMYNKWKKTYQAAMAIQNVVQKYLWRLHAFIKLKQLKEKKIEQIMKVENEKLRRKYNVIFVRRIHRLLASIMYAWKRRQKYLSIVRRSLFVWLQNSTDLRKKRYDLRVRSLIILQRFCMQLLLRKETRRLRRKSSILLQKRWRGVLGRRMYWLQCERVHISRLYTRSLWYDVRHITVLHVSGLNSEIEKRNVIKYNAISKIIQTYRRYLNKKMYKCLILYKQHQAANTIQSTMQQYLAYKFYTGKKTRMHHASNVIRRTYKTYRRKVMFSGILSALAIKRAENLKKEKKRLIEQMQINQKLKTQKKITDFNANIIQTRLKFYYALKKNYRILQKEERLLLKREEDRKIAIQEMNEGTRAFGTSKVEKEEWVLELENMKVEKRIPDLETHMNARKFGVIHRTVQWLKYKTINVGTSKETKRKRGLPELKPLMSQYQLEDMKKKKNKNKKKMQNKNQKPTLTSLTAMATSFTTTSTSKLIERAKSSVKRFQRGAVPIQGLVDLKFTVGDNEYNAMESEQFINKKGGRKHFTTDNKDLSKSYKRSDGTRMPAQRCILWTCSQSRRAQDLLCQIQIVPLQPGGIGTKYNIHDDEDDGGDDGGGGGDDGNKEEKQRDENGINVPGKDVQIVRHQRLPFELWLTRRGVTPLVSLTFSGRNEEKNRYSSSNPITLKKLGYRPILDISTNSVPQRLDNMEIMKDKTITRQRDFVMMDRHLCIWIKTVNTKSDTKFEKKVISDQLREGKKIQNISNFCMLEPHELNRLFDIFMKIQNYGYIAKRKSSKTKLQRKKIDKLQKSADAYNTISVDAVHLYLTEPKTPFTEFMFLMLVSSTGDGMKDDIIEEKKQNEETMKLMTQVHENIFTVSGEGIDAQNITFAGFCQTVCRYCLFDVNEILSLVFKLGNPEKVANLVTPFSFIQSMKSLHGIAGPNNHAKQNLRKVGKLIDLNTSKRDVHSINNTLIKEINKSYSAILYPAFRLQKQFQTKFLGVRFWNKKKIAFTKARKHLIESNFQ